MTPRSRLTVSAALASLALAAPLQARPAVPMAHPAPGKRLQWDSKKFMHVSELRPGMRGYALTVFKGTKIEKFGIEILGVVAKFNEGKDYIMFRATSGPPVTRGLGIAEGMSGSPIYIGGRLVGAISLGNQFAKDPIGFATPIEDMFDAWSPDLPAKMPSISASAPSAGSDKLDSSSFTNEMPLTVSGMNAQGVSRLSAALAPYHFNVTAGAGMADGATDPNPLAKSPSLVPGSAVGVALVQGDFDVNATGTVTYRDGNRLLLFGHPFQNLGPIDAALTTAYIVDIYPSYQTSFKLGSPIKTVGRIFQDRPFSVGGVIGPMPQMIPMTVSVNDESIHRRKSFRVRIINHPLLTGQFITAVADAAIARVHGDPGDSMAQVTLDVDAEEIGHIKRTNTYYSALGIDQAAVGDLDSLMHLLSSNPFYPLAVKSVAMTVTLQNRHDTAEIDHLFVRQSKFAPGDTVQVGVVLKPYKRPLYTRFVSVKIPLSTPDGTLPLNIRGGTDDAGGGTSLLAALLGLHSAEPAGAAASVAQLVRQFTEKAQNDQLVAHLTLPTFAVTLHGEKLSGLPPTLSGVMQSARTTGLRTERDEVKAVQDVPYIVSGSQTLSITVQRRVTSEAPQPLTAQPTPAAALAPLPAAPAAVALSDEGGDDAPLASAVDFAKKTKAKAEPVPVSEPTPAQAPALPKGEGEEGTAAVDTAAAGKSADAVLKPVGRLPSLWRQGTAAQFSAGTLKNVAVSSLGEVRLSPSLTKVADTGENYVWAIQPDGKGSVYLGTGDGGAIYKMDAGGKVSPFFQTKELEVTALALDDKGDLYAGTAPHGIVFRITPDGKGGKVFTAKEKYVTALAQGSREMYVATGGGTGRVYRLNEEQEGGLSVPGTDDSDVLFTSPEAHILSLTTDKDGNVYAGSAPNGIIYKIGPNIGRLGVNGIMPGAAPQSSVFYDADEANITALATDSQGNVYAGTSAPGTVYRIAPDGTAKRLLGKSPAGITSLKTDGADAVYASAGGTVYKINPDDSVSSYVSSADEQFISLALDPASRSVYAGAGTVGSVDKIDAVGGALQGTLQSTVHDAGNRARWGTVDWTADTPAGTSVTLQTRSGDVARPDASWSAWSAPYSLAAGQPVTSPPARYLQYQAVFTGAGTAAPTLRDVSVYYLPRDQAPAVSFTRPAAGSAVSKTAALQWSASDPDKDTLSYDVSYSADGGKTWTPITTRARLTAQTKTTTVPVPSAVPPAALSALQSAPAGVRALIQAQVAANQAAASAAAVPKPAQNLKETSYSWDTTLVPDGRYQIKVIASDRPSNPTGWLTAQAVSGSFLIVNTAPALALGTPRVDAGGGVTISGTARSSGQVFVRAVQAKVDGGDSVAASADDGLFDSPSEGFTLTVPALAPGRHTIEVQALDQAGNTTTQTATVTVP